MRNLIILVFIMSLTLSCEENKKNVEIKENEIDDIEFNQKTEADTVLEISSPEELDMNVHQLYIDTTKTNRIYKTSKGKHAFQNEELISNYIKEWDKGFKFIELDFKNHSKIWRTIRKKGSEFYLYDRCDGIDPVFSIYKNVLIFNEALEKDFQPIVRIIKLNENEIELELNGTQRSETGSRSFVSISKIDSLQGIYLFCNKTNYYERKQYVIPNEECKSYNLIINHCPTNKVEEYIKFENSSWQINK